MSRVALERSPDLLERDLVHDEEVVEVGQLLALSPEASPDRAEEPRCSWPRAPILGPTGRVAAAASVGVMAIPSYEFDIRARTLTLAGEREATRTFALPPGVSDFETNLERVAIRPDAAELTADFANGRQAVVDLRDTRRSLEELRARRPSVYLDQNHWSTIAGAREGRAGVTVEQARAAKILTDLVEEHRVLLPVSSGHLVETTPLHGDRRVALATTVLELERGWWMRNPVRVRAEEISHGVQGDTPVASGVFAPEVSEIFSSETSVSAAAQGELDSIAVVSNVVQAILGIYDTIADREPIPDEGGAAKAQAWAGNWADIATKVHAAGEPASMVRSVAYAKLIVDLADTLAEVAGLIGIPVEEVLDRLTADMDLLSQMPFLAQMNQLLFARLRNAEQRWEANDLIDIMFLSCAAGYADMLVGERATIAHLRQARAPRPRALLASSLAETEALEQTDRGIGRGRSASTYTRVGGCRPLTASALNCVRPRSEQITRARPMVRSRCPSSVGTVGGEGAAARPRQAGEAAR